MKKILKCAILIVILGSFFMDAHAETRHIWIIGDTGEKEFSSQEERVITYDVPLNWKDLLDEENPNWGQFPLELYSEASVDNNPCEVRINFDYPEDLNNPRLFIKAILGLPAGQGVSHNLVIYKGEDMIIEESEMNNYPSITYADVSVGHIKKGVHEENRIILKVDSASDIPVVFYSLWMEVDDGDSDGDGVTDEEEADEEMCNDSATTALPIRSYDPDKIKRIILRIKGEEGSPGRFREVSFIDANSLNLPGSLPSAHYFPYGFLGFRIEDIDPQGEVVLRLQYPEIIYPSARFYVSRDSGEWREVPFEIIDDYSADISLSDVEEDGQDRQRDGPMDIQLTLACPQGLGVHPDRTGCFISGVSGGDKR